ncbi:MAG: M56 family metallopeptidase [Oscillospiraceae bacterium]|nr:M56 family metallopeptidase [Oscillospiraceae bacterium]
MTQWIFTSSLLIAAVLLIRAIAGDKLSARLRYALWGLVLLRLLVPVSIGESALSLQNWLPREPREITNALTAVRVPADAGEAFVIPAEDYAEILSAETDKVQSDAVAEPVVPAVDETMQTVTPSVPTVQRETKTVNVPLLVWGMGMAVAGGVFLVSNLHFALRLRRSRRYAMTEAVPVYVTEAVEVPCLFGLLRPAIYITPDVWEDSMALRHVIAHELTHYRHGDHLWALLRCVAVTVHWYNPLAWAAAVLSRKDGELACDEGALHRLGGHERTAYARTLVGLTCGSPRGMLMAATSMGDSESDLKTRVLRIVKNPKMTVTACAAALLIAALIAVAVFTGEADPLRGNWYGAREDSGSYYGSKSLITTQVVFRDGRARITRYENDLFEWSALYHYKIKDDVLHLEPVDGAYEESYAFTWVGENGIDFGNSNSGLWCGLLSKGDPKDGILTDDPLMEITAITDLTRDETWVAASNLGWAEGAIVDMLLRAEVLAERPMPEPLTYTEYCYGLTAVEHGKTAELIFCDGWLYRDGVGYQLSNTDVVMERMMDIIWEPVGGYIDELGNRYSHVQQGGIALQVLTEHEYWDDRIYTLENEGRWKRAWEEAEAHSIVGEHQGEKILMYLSGLDGVYPNIWSDGTITYYEWVDTESGRESLEHSIRPEDAPKLTELLAPYMEMAEESVRRGAKQANINGSWVLESSPVAGVTQLQMGVAVTHRYARADKFAKIYATVNGGIVETEFDVYVLEDVFHIRYSDGREEAIPCELDGDILTLYADSGTWVFRKGQLDPVTAENTDIIRISRSPSTIVRLDMTDERLAELEALLRAGMVPAESNIIYSDEYFYKLLALEEVFDAPDVTLSDFGTLHFNGQCYELTNWEELEAFLHTLYRRV